MSQTQRKTTSLSLAIGSSASEDFSSSSKKHHSYSTSIPPVSVDSQRMQSPTNLQTGLTYEAAPVFTKGLQNIFATKGQLVVFECRIRASPTPEVRWFREFNQIIDSADFRILRKKACSSLVPEEVCTLVITEAFPEDSGTFKCIAANEFGAVVSSASLLVTQGTEETEGFNAAPWLSDTTTTMNISSAPNNPYVVLGKDEGYEPSSVMPQNPSDFATQVAHDSSWPQTYGDESENFHGMYEKPSDNSFHWDCHHQESHSLLRQGFYSSQEPSQERPQNLSSNWFQPPIQSPFPPSKTQDNCESVPMSISNLPSVSSMYQPSMFNYERPKHFIQSQNPYQGKPQPPGPETSATLPSRPIKQSSILIQPCNPNEKKFSSSSSLSSPISLSSPSCSASFPVTPASAQSPASSSSGQRISSMHNQSPAAFLCSVLPSSHFDCNSQGPSSVDSNSYSKPMYKKQTSSTKQVQKTSDREIQGTKDALIQDLERKLRCKDNLLHNGNQRLSYEERMARRLLGPENAASVFEPQSEENAQDTHQNMESTRLQVPTPQVRSRPSSRGERNEQGSIQEKFFQPRFLQVPEDVTVEEGRFCRLDFKVSGLPTPDVAWFLNGRQVHPDDFHKMLVSEKGFHSFIFEVVRVYDAGTWECVAFNRAGEASFRVKLDVIAREHRKAPVFIYKPQSTKVYEGDSARLECQVSAIPPPQIYWKRNNEMVQFNTDRISMFHDTAGKVCLLIHNTNKKDAGWYTVSAVNEAGVATCHARLDVATHTYKPMPNPKPLKVRPTFSKYLALNGKGLNVKQAFLPDEGEFQRMAAQSGLYESDEL
ncbi:myotilin isoform X2 [Varanus komodoensis]|uniref:myotilin isoform X2 n=1 Tax=Varanus komodoensis TaxID=61221 RepID=UPI001CF793A8|nr:myotilin isoform X2 [Varanus komodoensis]